jgi:ubiquitin carboxyl-terminal hydrolase L5
MEEWLELSRDPRDLTSFIQNLGSSGVEVEEIYNLDSLEDSKQVHGIILLYSWNPSIISESLYTAPDLCNLTLLDPKLSLTLGLMTVLFNTDVQLSAELEKFKESILPLNAKLRSVAVHSSATFRALQSTFSSKLPSQKQLFFTTFIPKSGKVVEIDGLASGPFLLSEVAEDDWIDRTKHILTERISKFHKFEVDFSIFTVINNKKAEAEKSIKSISRKILSVQKKLGLKTIDFDSEFFESLPDDQEMLESELASLEEAKMLSESLLKAEDQKHEIWRDEISRRKHNFIPFITSFLQKLEHKKQLSLLLERALKKKLGSG